MITVVTAVAALWPTAGSAPGIQLPGSLHDWLIVLYLALIASALTMVLQTWAQAHIEPSRAAVIMAMEPVWAAAFAVALGGENVTARMIIGGVAIVSAMYLVERPQRRRTEPTATKEYVA
jgi:drug/metabolite transporter (DMT)-like permease